MEILSGGSALIRPNEQLMEWRVIKGASSDDDDAADVSEE